jgi:hypothetical protein
VSDDTYSALSNSTIKLEVPERYIGISGFKDDAEHDILFKKIQELVMGWECKRTVFK